jgi:hypothetical protein
MTTQTTTQQLIAHRERLIAMKAEMSRYTYAPGLLFDNEIKETTRLISEAIHAHA